jgi:hypothetical protein
MGRANYSGVISAVYNHPGMQNDVVRDGNGITGMQQELPNPSLQCEIMPKRPEKKQELPNPLIRRALHRQRAQQGALRLGVLGPVCDSCALAVCTLRCQKNGPPVGLLL